MKANKLWILILAFALVIGYLPIVNLAAVKITPKSTLKVLFIGNSFTFYKNMPLIVKRIADAKGTPMDVKFIAKPGMSLKDNWDHHNALLEIKKEKWDYVVLQGSSREPYKNKGEYYTYARLFDREIKKAGAKTVLYMTWSDLTPEGMPDLSVQIKLNKSIEQLSGELNALLAPVGPVWNVLYNKVPQLKTLYSKDNHHPSALGAYISACVFYSTLFNKSPEGDATTEFGYEQPYQRVVWKAYRNFFKMKTGI